MKKFVAFLLLLIAIGAAGAWLWSGRQPPPAIAITKPGGAMGQGGVIEFTVDAPAIHLLSLDVTFEQGGKQTPLFALGRPGAATLVQEGPNRIRVTVPATRKEIPDLKSGDAKIVVHASRGVLRNLRTLSASASHDLRVQLEPPRVSVLSTHHYINLGGTEFVVLRVTPADAAGGVRVGDSDVSGVSRKRRRHIGPDGPSGPVCAPLRSGSHHADWRVRVGRRGQHGDGAARLQAVPQSVPPQPHRGARRVSPARRAVDPAELPDFAPEVPDQNDLVAAFLKINGELRRKNADLIASFARQTAPQMLWRGPFQQLGNSQVEAAFADHRTYFYKGKEIDQQVHLGFDLAVTSGVAVIAANNGKVVHAAWLGIYGNCVIIDHGLGAQSLYAHLSSIEVKVGDTVTKGQTIGRSGMTGLAGGDHLHFTMLVNGQAVNAVEWWDQKWMEDRVLRKIREAGGQVP